ncbi:MAG: SPOR domain-containing protein [Flavobacteriaceae bacterium]|nr:SPOR domain-containing protein [Flavobacteriaceae bacterium]MDG1422440.1 SPOR domain-containing protein [Flavobacteriaceae bacterium]
MKKTKLTMCIFLVVVLTTNFTYSQSKKSDNTLIKELISKKKSFNKEFGYGFRIQLYNGIEAVAIKTMRKFKSDFPDIETHLEYKQPEWKTQVGFYKTKLEADRALLNFKRKYQSAIVIPLGK